MDEVFIERRVNNIWRKVTFIFLDALYKNKYDKIYYIYIKANLTLRN